MSYINDFYFITMGFFIILVSYLGLNYALESPRYMWPFGGDSFTYDVVHGQIGSFPNLTDCFLVGPNHPSLSYSSLFFDRNTSPYIDVQIPSDSSIQDFGLAFFVNPLNGTGIIFHYMTQNQSAGSTDIRHMYLAIHNGKIQAGLTYASLLNMHFPKISSYSVPSNQWSMIAIVNDYMAKNMSIYVDTLQESRVHGITFSLKLPGMLRFGDGIPTYLPNEPFYGYITAAALYNTAKDIDRISDLLQNAQKRNWLNIPSLPPCPDRVQKDVLVKHLWPLDEKGLTVDINTNNVDENSPCLRFGQNHPRLPNSVIHIDGSPLSYITLIINGSEIDETFTLTLYTFISSQSSGSLMKIINTQDQTLFEVAISGTDIEFNAFTSTTTNCASLSMAAVFTQNTWYAVGILRNVVANSLGIMIDGNINETTDTCGVFGLSGELFLQIGSSNRQLPGYIGDVRCLIWFQDPGSDILTAINDECTNADSTVIGQVNDCTIENLRSRYHYLFKSDEVPPSSLSPIATYTSRHLTECAINCYLHLFCRSFTYLRNQCAVYDFVTEYGMRAETGSGYYVVDNRI